MGNITDLFYCGDLMKRITDGHLIHKNAKQVQASAEEVLERICTRYNYFRNYKPKYNEMPDLDALAEQALEAAPRTTEGPLDVDSFPF